MGESRLVVTASHPRAWFRPQAFRMKIVLSDALDLSNLPSKSVSTEFLGATSEAWTLM